MFNVFTRQEGKALALSLQGKFDFEAVAQLKIELQEVFTQKEPRWVLLNLEGVALVDSSAVGFLVALRGGLARNGGELRLCHVPAGVMRILTHTSLAEQFRIFATEPEALRF